MRSIVSLSCIAFIECAFQNPLLSYTHGGCFRSRLSARSAAHISRVRGPVVTKLWSLRGGGPKHVHERSSAAATGEYEGSSGDLIDAKPSIIPEKELSILFLGTGVSTGLPKLGCIVRPDPTRPECAVCKSALNPNSRNRRGNVSVLLRFLGEDGRVRSIMVDAGKTMREACLRHLPNNGVRGIDALLITHAHADAILGTSRLCSIPAPPPTGLISAAADHGRAGRPARLFRAGRREAARGPAASCVSEPGDL
jgi:hypothetical protein